MDRNKKVVIIDDETILNLCLTDIVQTFNCDVISFSSSKEALTYIENKNDVDIFFVDLNMPVISGVEIVKKIKENNPDSKIVILTGLATKEVEQMKVKYGINYIVYKPFQFDEIRNIIL